MSGLYDLDFVEWSEQQADRLRRMARGETVKLEGRMPQPARAVTWAEMTAQ